MVRGSGYGRAGRGGVRTTLASMIAIVMLLAFFAGSVTAHNAVATCGGFLQLDFPSKTADIIRTSDSADTLVWDNVNGGGKFAVTPGTYKVVWSDGYTKSNIVVAACATPTPTATPAPTPTATVTLGCQYGLKVILAQYNSGATNTVTAWIDSVQVSGSPFSFGSSFSQNWPVDPTVAHAAKVMVYTSDDPSGTNGWTRTFWRTLQACQKPTDAPTDAPTLEPVVTPTPTASGTVVPATGTPGVTPPATDSIAGDGDGSGPGSGLALVLILLGGASIALLPVTSRRPRR